MKVLIDHTWPFFLAHGGFQIQIEQTKAAIESTGVQVEYVRWWDDRQTGDVIHFFGRPSGLYVEFAHKKKLKVVLAELLTGMGSRSPTALFAQKAFMVLASRLLPSEFSARMGWESYRTVDACVANTPWEASLMTNMFSVPKSRVHFVPNGVEDVFFRSAQEPRGPWLVCTAIITGRKRTLELAEAAVEARTPVWIVGKPFHEADPYAVRFTKIASENPQWVRYEGPVSDRARLANIYRQARGFVLLSTMETLSLSSLEAAACGCPLLLSDLPWARSIFGPDATYCRIGSRQSTAATLRDFYDRAPKLAPPPRPKTWPEVGHAFVAIYKTILNRPV